jgi:hypothetical protein
MKMLRSMLFGAVAVAGLGLGATAPASAEARFYIGPDGARVYYDDDDDYRAYAACHNEVSYGWRYGERVRIVDRVCYSRWGGRYIADRDYYPTGGYYDWDD